MKANWKPGQHIGIVGPTGSGKSYIARDLLELRKYAVVFATKSKDRTLEEYNFEKFDRWPVEYDTRLVILWKKAKRLGDYNHQRMLIYNAMDDIYRVGGWTMYFDDLYYVSETLGLKRAIQMLYTQVRSQDVSIISSFQRPRWVPLEAVSQASYILCFRVHDRLDVARIAEGMGIDRQALQGAMQQLEQYQFLLIKSSDASFIKILRRE